MLLLSFYLLYQSQKTGFITLIRDMITNGGKKFIGSSAGSIIAGPKLPEYQIELDDPRDYILSDSTSYGFVNFTILPHWGTESFKERYLGGTTTPDKIHTVLPDVMSKEEIIKAAIRGLNLASGRLSDEILQIYEESYAKGSREISLR
jgi:hypothetical protein